MKVTLARHLDEVYDFRRKHARNALRGSEVRIAGGAYVDAGEWTALGARERYLVKIRAVVETRRHRAVLSHRSAAAIHGLPALEPWPGSVHFTAGVTSGGRSSGDVVRHSAHLADGDVVEIDGLLVTSIARTVLDLAVAEPELASVTALDRALHIDRKNISPTLLTTEELWRTYNAHMPFRGHVRARNAFEFAVTEADSPLESVSRVNMRIIGFPAPELQHRFDDYRGLIGYSEFYWPKHGLVGEADGRSKYTDPAFKKGRSLEQVLLDEKERADRIRATGPDVSRWGWQTAIQPEALRRHLVAAGLPTA
ncbi:hypothetical protein [Conyzicola sp.]|uniref:hypothetical protein n=1 Tax=Conyzicola sp. TaxID=1969404 RepID=UPI003989B8AA